MESRDTLKRIIVTGLEQGLRNESIKSDINKNIGPIGIIDEDSVEEKVKNNRKYFEELAEKWVRDYETYLLRVLGENIATTVREKIGGENLLIKNIITELTLSIDNNHSCLLDNILGVSDFQRRIRMQILEEEIEKIQLDHTILQRHQEALDKVAQKEARKVSWAFFLIAIISTASWVFVIFQWGWNDMEKWTFVLGSGCLVFLFNSLYYALFERQFTSENLKKEKFEKIRLHNYDLHKFDIKFLNTVKALLDRKKEEYNKLSQKNNMIQ